MDRGVDAHVDRWDAELLRLRSGARRPRLDHLAQRQGRAGHGETLINRGTAATESGPRSRRASTPSNPWREGTESKSFDRGKRLADWIAAHRLRQADAAAILMVTRPRVSDVVNRKTAKFTIDALVEMLGRAGKCVSVAVR